MKNTTKKATENEGSGVAAHILLPLREETE